MEHLSALVLTYNEEDNIGSCLDSIKWIESVFVDSKLLEVYGNGTI